ncbi:hypothetical protein [Sphingomonas bacterium]|uniref:hypothetical protein n=1 Tax=Sphingomonas bacterium TaxID=1895847 RepID=UPI002610998E|nr:hypothetical protein [Sphingomonas bacterium]MDB5677700.1 hypothetical protein [Sphingomonas bacterium]
MNKVFGVIAGLAAAFVTIFAIEAIDTMLYPLPTVESDDPAALAHIIAAMPFFAKLLVVAGFLLGALFGAAVALRLSQWRPSGWIVAGIIAAGGLSTVITIPHPLWMQVASVAVPLIGGWLAERHFHRARPGDPLIG